MNGKQPPLLLTLLVCTAFSGIALLIIFSKSPFTRTQFAEIADTVKQAILYGSIGIGIVAVLLIGVFFLILIGAIPLNLPNGRRR